MDELRQFWSMVLLKKVITDVQLLLTYSFHNTLRNLFWMDWFLHQRM